MVLVNSYPRQLALLIAFTLLTAIASAETLGDVLRDHQIAFPEKTVADVRQRVTGYAVLDNPDAFAIAYYRDSGSNLIEPHLFLLRYFKTQHRWQSGELRQASVKIGRFTVDCFGSAQSFEEFYGVLYITTHLSPSAACTLILRQDFTLRKTLSGWFLASFRNGLVIFHNSEVHFAPTHPMQISIYDPRKGSEKKIYPPVGDRERASYIDELDAEPPDEEWCRVNNSHCESEMFSSDLRGPIEIDEMTRSIGFVAIYTPEGYGPKAENEVGDKQVIYIYRFSRGKLFHREFAVEKAKEIFGTDSVASLLSATMLRKIFARGAASFQ